MELDDKEEFWPPKLSCSSDSEVRSWGKMSIDAEDGHGQSQLPRNQPEQLFGVVEGFYGAPWSLRQRESLMRTLGKLGISTYIYAPKDDNKHRKNWKERYTPTECDLLKRLVSTAKDCGVNFVYSISPGLDITFSSEEDVNALKSKLKQIQSLGCECFAVFFDDIELKMPSSDLERYGSSANAQAEVTNCVYESLDCPNIFLFCPTEYCSSRCKPSLLDSQYLRTIGEKLHPCIGVMWTGPRVISKSITREHLMSIASVIKRKPIIWDNLHANDYDKRQIFLGPYHSRPLNISHFISGIFINPNCQFDLNFIPIHSFSMWVSTIRGNRDSLRGSTIELEGCIDHPKFGEYNVSKVLRDCCRMWIGEFQRHESLARHETDSRREHQHGQPVVWSSDGSFGDSDDSSPVTDSSHESHPGANLCEGDIMILVNFFYLPSKLGKFAKDLLLEFSWIKSNFSTYWKCPDSEQSMADTKKWAHKHRYFKRNCSRILSSLKNIQRTPNLVLKNILSPFVCEVRESIESLLTYVNYLELRENDPKLEDSITDPDSWISKSRFSVEVEKLLPSFTHEDALSDISPPSPVFVIRPAIYNDKRRVLHVCANHLISKSGFWDDARPPDNLMRLRYLESFYRADYDMYTVEDSDKLCGYLLMATSVDAEVEKEIEEEYNDFVLQIIADPEVRKIFGGELKYPPHVQSIAEKFPMRIFICFQIGFKRWQITTNLMQIITDKLRSKKIDGAYIVVDKYEFMEPNLLDKLGFYLHPDGHLPFYKYYIYESLPDDT